MRALCKELNLQREKNTPKLKIYPATFYIMSVNPWMMLEKYQCTRINQL